MIKLLCAALGTAALAVAASLACSEKIKTVRYSVKTEKVVSNVKILQISDLHGARYGDRSAKLIDEINGIAPDAVVLTGDIIDEKKTRVHAYALLEYLGKNYRTYYVSGNHEQYTNEVNEIKSIISEYGIKVLCGEGDAVTLNGSTVVFYGIDDPYCPLDSKGRYFEDQLFDCDKECDRKKYNILLSHRPEFTDLYSDTKFDMILSGHAHGGQIIVPKLINGLYSPHQGWLPKYAGGRYLLSDRIDFIVSRGLSKKIRPRVLNRPELVLIELHPALE